MIQITGTAPNVLIVSGPRKRISQKVAKYCANLGARVMIVNISLIDNSIIIEDINQEGVRYASITREVNSEKEARQIIHTYLGDCPKLKAVINFAGPERAELINIIDILDPEGGVLYTAT